MYKRVCFLISFVLVLSLASTTYGIQLGNFENPADPNHDGWSVVDPNDPNVLVDYDDTNGVTLGSYSLRVDSNMFDPNNGFRSALQYSLTDHNMVDDFRHNLKVSLDVTRLASEWVAEDGGQYCEIFLVVQAGRDGDPNEPNDPNEWDLWLQLSENAGWSPAEGNEPMSVTYDYSLTLNQIDFNNLGYLNFILCTNWGEYNPGGIYYIDNIQMFGGGPAYDPNPADRAINMPSEITLSWTPGCYADKHDVYFGTNFNDVSDANRASHPGLLYYSENYAANTYVLPDLLDFDRTYYWRIDEVNDACAPYLWKGEVWTFATSYLGGGLVLGDWEDDMDGWTKVVPRVSLSYSTIGVTLNDKSLRIQYPSGEDGWEQAIEIEITNLGLVDELLNHDTFTLDVTWLTSDWTGGDWAKIEQLVVLGEGIGWNELGFPDTDTSNPGAPGNWNLSGFGRSDTRTITWDYKKPEDVNWAALPPDPDYMRLIIVTNFDTAFPTGTFYFDNARLLDSRLALNPKPPHNATDVECNPTLSWKSGKYADKHDVYLGDDFFDVSDANTDNHSQPGLLYYSGDQDANSYPVSILTPGKTYYWRVDEVNEAGPDPKFWQGDIWSFTVGIPRASNPVPPDDANFVSPVVQLSWREDPYTDKHDVYFGIDFNDVNDADRDNHTQPGLLYYSEAQDANYYPVGGALYLDFNQVYYWRIDEVNTADPCVWKGSVWSFTTAPYLLIDDFESYNPSLAGTWIAGGNATASLSVKPIHEGEQAMEIDYSNAGAPYFSEASAIANTLNSLLGNNWRAQDVKALSLWFHGIPDLSGSYTYAGGKYTLTADGIGIPATGKADSFHFVYGLTTNATGSIYARVLNVKNTDPYAKAGVMIRDTLDQDARFGAVVVTPEKGVMFQYRATAGGSAASVTKTGITAPCWVKVEYVKQGPTAFVKGYYATTEGVPTSWTAIGQAQVTLGTLNLGLCATSSSYDKMCTARISDVTTLPVTALTNNQDIGRVYNDAAPMYVVLEDGLANDGIVYHPDPNVTRTGAWKEWRIDLNDFIVQGVNVADVDKIYIGFGDKAAPGGSGIVYIDDIRLYLAEFYEPECPWDKDLARNGVIDFGDLRLAAKNWLMSDYNVTPVPPTVGPVSRYQLDGNADDSGPGGHDGEPCGVGIAYNTTDYKDASASLELTGDGSYISTNANAAVYGIDGNNPRTITAWAYARDFSDNIAGIYEIGGYDWQQHGQDFALRVTPEPNVWRAQHIGEPDWDIDFTYPSLNRWVHFAHTYDGTTVRVYADGYIVAERVLDINTATDPNAKTFSIGRWKFGSDSYYFDGLIDDVRIYNEVLNQNEVASLAGKTVTFTQPLHMARTSAVDTDLYDDGTMDFKDIAELGKVWGEQRVWPTWDP